MNRSPPRPPGTTLPDDITIREFNDGDSDAVVALMRELQVAEQPFNAHLKPVDDIGPWFIDRILDNCRKQQGVVLIAEQAGIPAGCAVLYTRIEESGEEEEKPHSYALVSELIVTEGARGRGIGKALISACEAYTLRAGQPELRLAVFARNDSAYRLYRSTGYEDVKIRMAKALA